jgi:hypothetical protein
MKSIIGKNLPAYDGGGDASTPDPVTGLVTLDVDSHYFVINADEAEIDSIHILTGALIAGVFTVETCNFPRKRDEVGPNDVTDYDETAGNWIKEDPTTAYVASVGTGWTVANLTLTKTAGAAGAMIHLGNLGARRVRLKAAITTGGTIRVVAHGKG